MLRKVATALIAVTMFTAPVLAQSAAPVSPASATQPIKAKSAVKHVKIKKHTVKMAMVNRHRTHQACTAREVCEVFARRSGFDQAGSCAGPHQLIVC